MIEIIFALLVYKFFKNILDQCSQYLQMNYGIQAYSALYLFYIKKKGLLNGKMLNIIEDDI